MASLRPELHNLGKIFNQSKVIENGNPSRYHVKPRTDPQSEPFRKMTFGERDTNKPHKTILMVGETGTGKTTLINVMINYMLGVQREDKVWFEITDDQSDRTSVHSQTSKITVYEFYLQESPIHLTIIDTPGYGNTRAENEKEIVSFLSLCKSAEEIHELHAVCLVIKATQTRLSDRQIYIFDAVQSLFGKDIVENIVLLFTHSRGAIPKNVMTAVEEAKIKCAVNDENQPVYFLFDNCQSEAADEDDEILEQLWNLSFSGMTGFFTFLKNIKPKSLKMTRDVLQQRGQLKENISKIQSHIQNIEKKQNELKQTQEDLEKNKENDIDPSVSKVAMCCTCEENSHYPGHWWDSCLSCCGAVKDNRCTVCSNKYCKEGQSIEPLIHEKQTEKRQYENLKKSSIKKLEEELQEFEEEEIKLVFEAFHCVETLEMIALNTDSLITLQHIDFLIEKLKEINEPEKAETLENIKKRAGEEKQKAAGIHEKKNRTLHTESVLYVN